MQGAVLSGGGDYPANEFIIGSGADALLCRYKAGRRRLDDKDQADAGMGGCQRPLPRRHDAHGGDRRTGLPPEGALQRLPAKPHRHRRGAATGKTFGDVFDVHARVMDERGLTRHRLNSCGYSLGARFSPSWMEHQMFHAGNSQEIASDMTLFVHMIVMDSDSGTAMTLGQTYLTTQGAPEPLSRHSLDLLTA